MPRKKTTGFRPGELYKNIVVERGLPQEKQEKLFKKKMPFFVRFCKKVNNMMPSLGGKAKYSEDIQASIDFLNWDLSAGEFASGINFVLVVSIAVVLLGWFALISSPLADIIGSIEYGSYLLLGVMLLGAVYATRFMYMYPAAAAEVEQKKAMGYIPEIIGYMIMSMKLTPNLEKSVEFAADHGRGKISEEFKKVLWDVELGVYATIAEALDKVAYRWGKYSPEFKRAIMRIRASVLEETEAKRDTALNTTMDELLASIKEKMDRYAQELKQPVTVLFFIGVLLPLILMVILPIGSVFSGIPLANPLVIIALYNVMIPLGTFYFARSIIKKRPPTYEPPEIPDDYPGLPPKGKIKMGNSSINLKLAVILVACIGVMGSYYLHLEGFPPKSFEGMVEGDLVQIIQPDQQIKEVIERSGFPADYFEIPGGTLYRQHLAMHRQRVSLEEAEEMAIATATFEKKQFFMREENDITPYNLLFGLMLTIAVCIFVAFYYPNKYKRKVQEEVMEMEAEFKDALYIIASRLGEHKPIEEAFSHAKEFLPNAKITQTVFSKTLDNINLLGMPIESAIFDSRFGTVTKIPSEIIKTGMRLVVDSSRLGTSIAARTIASLSLQLDNTEKVAKSLKETTADLVITMRSMGVIIAPMVLGITTVLFKIVVLTMANITAGTTDFGGTGLGDLGSAPGIGGAGDLGRVAESFGRVAEGGFLQPESLAFIAEPVHFIIITGIYVVQIVLIILYFAVMLEEKNPLLLKLSIAKYLPMALAIYTITVMASNLLLGTMGG